MLFQNDPRLNKEINHVGCAYISLAFFREHFQGEPWTASALNQIWDEAKKQGIISGDLNKDGDTDDAGQLEVQDWQRLANLLGCKLRYIPGHYPIDSPQAIGCYTICAWYNPNTKFTHFVVGTKRPVIFDPIAGGSRTVREGAPKSDGLRIFQILA
jgi:hypothetical protein